MLLLTPRKIVRAAAFLLAFCTGLSLSAQSPNFPVRASVSILEASPYLEDYGRDGNLLIMLTLVDNQPNYQGLVRVTIQGNGYRAETRDLLALPPISLNFGSPVILRGADLAPYFDLNNLVTEGIALDNTLGNGGALPDGPVTICVEVYDVNRFSEPPVSNPACAVRFVQQHYPPELVNPLGEQIIPPVVNFTWNPRHVPQPANDVYDLDVWEKIPGLTTDQIINSAPQVTPTITTMIPRYVFTNYDGRLAADKTYIWRVRVRDRRNVRTFINDGYSQPGEFHFGEDPNAAVCPELRTFYPTGTTANNAGLVWTLSDTTGITGYDLRYRVAGTEDWANLALPGGNLPTASLNSLNAGSDYEAELCAICTDGSTSCLKTTFTTLRQDSDCGPLPYPTVVPVSEDAISLSWEANEAAAGYRLYWSRIIAPPVPPRQETVPEGPRNRNRNRRISPLRRTPPGTRAPSPASPGSSTATPDSLSLSAGTTGTEIGGLVAGNDYRFRFCQLCPDGTQTCYEWTVDFNGVDDGCLTSLTFTRPDSTDMTLDLAWAYDPNDVSATDSFTLIWRLADGGGPELTATVAYADAAYTITDRIPGQAYTLRVCAECTIAQPTCRELPPFGGCVSEYQPELVDLDDKRALLGWPVDAPPAVPTQARYAMRSFLNWTDLPTETFEFFNPEDHPFPADQLAETPRLATNLVYLGQVRTQCFDTLWSAWSEPVEFSTGCSVVDPLEAVVITDVSATILAVPRANANYYQFNYRLRADTEEAWTLLDNVTAPGTELTNLLSDTTYQVKMRYWCNLGVWSDYTEVLEFRTLPPCGIPEDAAATELLETAARLGWGPGENAVRTTLNYRRFAAPTGSGQANAEAPNQAASDGGDDDGDGPPPPPPPPTGVGEWLVLENLVDEAFLDELDGGARYVYRLQSDCEVNVSEWTVVQDFTLLCAAPDDVSVADITPFSARVSIVGLSPSAGTHQYSYRLLGEEDWMDVTRGTAFTTLQELDDLATYEVRVRTRCSSGEYSGWSDTLQFQTLVDCRVPTNFGVANLTTNSADLRWDVTGTVTRWELRIYDPSVAPSATQQATESIPAGGFGDEEEESGGTPPRTPNGGTRPGPGGGTASNGNNTAVSDAPGGDAPAPDPYANWLTITTTDPAKTLSGLMRNRKYKVVVRAECPTFGWTDFTEVLEFSPLCPQPVIDTATADDIGFRDVTLNWPSLNPCLLQYRVVLESLEPYPTTTTSSSPASRGGPNSEYWQGQQPPTVYRDSATTLETTALFENLRPNTEYRFRVRGYFDKSVFEAGPNGYLLMSDGPFGASSGLWGENAGAGYVIGEPGWGDYSEWITFRTDHCAAPYDLVETPLGRSTMELSWMASNGLNEFEVKYKLAEDAGSSWVYETVNESFIVLENLLSNAIYDYQVTEVCQDGETLRAAPRDTFMMERPSLNNGFYVCGMLTDVDLSNEIPLAELLEDDTIRAFDFPVVIVEVSGGNGYFSGVGEIRVPYFNKAKMQFEFDNIFVNDEYQMVGGYMEATGFGVEVLPPWADTLLSGIIDGLEMLDDMYQDQQVDQLDSLLMCCSDAIPQGLEDQMQAVVDCFDAVDEANTAAFDSCEALMDELLITIQEDLTEIVDSLGEEILDSKTIDLIRIALDSLKTIHSPDLVTATTNFNSLKSTFQTTYNLISSEEPPPALPSNMSVVDKPLPSPEGTINEDNALPNQQLTTFRTDALAIREEALVLTEKDLFSTLTDKIVDEPRSLVRDFGETMRADEPLDTDIFSLIRTLVGDLEEGQDPRDLLDEVMILVSDKITFLVRE